MIVIFPSPGGARFPGDWLIRYHGDRDMQQLEVLQGLLVSYEAALRGAGEATDIRAYVTCQTEAHRLEGVILTMGVENAEYALQKIRERVGQA
ncbi:MAG: hypothetical protein AB7F35_01205 [Acetobacteraceae bacterium]